MITKVERWLDEAMAVFMPKELEIAHDDVWSEKEEDPAFQPETKDHPIEERDGVADAACLAAKRAMLRKSLEDAGLKVTECDLCGGPIEDKCGAVCEGCNWIKPCSLE